MGPLGFIGIWCITIRVCTRKLNSRTQDQKGRVCVCVCVCCVTAHAAAAAVSLSLSLSLCVCASDAPLLTLLLLLWADPSQGLTAVKQEQSRAEIPLTNYAGEVEGGRGGGGCKSRALVGTLCGGPSILGAQMGTQAHMSISEKPA